jgi:hypothetical protein
MERVGKGEGQDMPLYMTQFAYTSEAWAALTQNPENRGEAIANLAQSMGGRMLSFYNSFGEIFSEIRRSSTKDRPHGRCPLPIRDVIWTYYLTRTGL